MGNQTSRRDFVAGALGVPAGGLASVSPLRTPTALEPPAGAPTAAARYKALGRTGLKLTTVGFGCMVTSDSSVIVRALDAGINHFDTARVYARGNNERMLGAALGSRRKSVIVSSKTLNTNDKAAALADLEASLRTIGTDYLDIWYLHDKSSGAGITGGLIDAQQTAKKQGKIRFAGLSVHSNHSEVIPAVVRNGNIDVLLTTYNFAMDGAALEPLLATAHQAGIGVIAMKVMAGSFRLENIDERKRAGIKRPGVAVAALKWVLRNPNVDAAIPSIVDADQLEQDAGAMGAEFTPADGRLLAAQLERIRPLYCRMCGRCTGLCPEGLPVADVLRYLTYAEGYGQFALGRENFLAMPEELRAVRCGDCTECAIDCPFGVRVAERLIRAQELFA